MCVCFFSFNHQNALFKDSNISGKSLNNAAWTLEWEGRHFRGRIVEDCSGTTYQELIKLLYFATEESEAQRGYMICWKSLIPKVRFHELQVTWIAQLQGTCFVPDRGKFPVPEISPLFRFHAMATLLGDSRDMGFLDNYKSRLWVKSFIL